MRSSYLIFPAFTRVPIVGAVLLVLTSILDVYFLLYRRSFDPPLSEITPNIEQVDGHEIWWYIGDRHDEKISMARIRPLIVKDRLDGEEMSESAIKEVFAIEQKHGMEGAYFNVSASHGGVIVYSDKPPRVLRTGSDSNLYFVVFPHGTTLVFDEQGNLVASSTRSESH